MFSPVFNTRQIQVLGNSQISTEQIIELSGVRKDENMFRLNRWRQETNIRTEAYIESARIRRHLNGTVNIHVEERTAEFMLYLNGIYGYINNQGYILEMSEVLLEAPIITGFGTEIYSIEAGNRLEESDLGKLGVVIRIMSALESYNIAHLVTSIDISDEQNYILELREEGKTVHFGDSSGITRKAWWLVSAIEQERGIDGEFFLQNINRPFFRERVIF